MAIGLSVFLIAIGAIFRFGITVDLNSIDFHAIGLIIMLAGAALLLIQMFWVVRARAVTDRRSDDTQWRRDGDSYWYRNDTNRPTYRDTTYRGNDDTPPLLARRLPPRAAHGVLLHLLAWGNARLARQHSYWTAARWAAIGVTCRSTIAR
jgi:Domain of unknown function (DUF6458)